jgi:SAM-dependent methyltransferase
MSKLNLGCGKDIRKGWINLDLVELPGVDVVHDLSVLPLPFADQSLDEVLCQDILEHVEYVALLRDIHRILRKGGKLFVRVPHFTSKDAFSDPTHKKIFTSHTFRYFTEEHLRSYYFDFSFARFTARILFDKRAIYFYNYLLEPVVNLNERARNFYEGSPLRIFPATNIEVVLEK